MTSPFSSPKLSIALATLTAIVASAAFADGEEPMTWEPYSYEAYPLARISEDVDRYPMAMPASLTVNQHGEVEHLGDAVFGTH